jgi:hypothetical protein
MCIDISIQFWRFLHIWCEYHGLRKRFYASGWLCIGLKKMREFWEEGNDSPTRCRKQSGIFISYCDATAHLGPRPPHLGFVYHTQLDTHTRTHARGRNPLNEWSTRRRGRYLHNTQQTKDTNSCAAIGIRTGNPSNKPAAELRHREHGHRDRCRFYLNDIVLLPQNFLGLLYISGTKISYSFFQAIKKSCNFNF